VPEFVALSQSGWFARSLRAHPEWSETLASLAEEALTRPRLDALIGSVRAQSGYRDRAHLRSTLRQVRNLWLGALMERDLSGRADLAEVMAATTHLAERSIGEALAVLGPELASRHGVPVASAAPVPQDLMVVAMGKLGGAELNVSSDIDLVFVYGEEGETAAAAGQRSISNQEFFTRLGQNLIAALSEVTADGFVFRVDMRLRPNGESGPLVVSLAMLEEYLITQGRPWERFAWLKSRPLVTAVFAPPSEALARSLEEVVTPFVFRRYLDFGAIEALRALHGQIRGEIARRDASRPGQERNVKLGRGGIREIEFLVQHFQLVRGGREPRLRSRSTLATLATLGELGLLDQAVVARLRDTYELLRNVEHRLQYVDDAQTHVVPLVGAPALALARACARLIGTDSEAGLFARLDEEQAFVAQQFDEVFGARESASEVAPLWSESSCAANASAEVLAALSAQGYPDPAAAQSRLRALWSSSAVRSLGESHRERIDVLMPRVIEAAVRGATPSCEAGSLLGRLCDVIEAIAKRSSYIALLIEYPRAFEHVVTLLAASPWAARFLALHPLLLDELLDTRSRERLDAGALRLQLAHGLERLVGDTERGMDLLREVQHLESFRLLIQDLEKRLSVEALSDDLAALADAIIGAALGACWELVRGSIDHAPAFAVIAYGKLGGKELGYTSDLDLVFLYDESRSDEAAAVSYARLGQRLMSWLTSRTPAGGLFDVDVRLRPEGAAGLLVSSCAAFESYQLNHAWVWEHQALTRARCCAGDAQIAARFEAQRRATLALPRELSSLRTEVSDMRRRMHEGHPNRSGQFDLKHDAGGMVDLEFCVQFLVLAHSHRYAQLLDNLGNIALLGRAASVGLIDTELALRCADAYRQYRRRTHELRLAGAPFARVEATHFVELRQDVARLSTGLGLSL
jgi:glutamate-ammonia-ligase adenylyltransferase